MWTTTAAGCRAGNPARGGRSLGCAAQAPTISSSSTLICVIHEESGFSPAMQCHGCVVLDQSIRALRFHGSNVEREEQRFGDAAQVWAVTLPVMVASESISTRWLVSRHRDSPGPEPGKR